MIFSLFLVLLAVLLTGISQVLLKTGSSHQGKRKRSFLDAYLNIYTISGYGIFLFVTVISVIALREIPLKTFYVIASLGFVVVVGLSWWILKEAVTKKMLVGIVLIVFGVFVFNVP